MRSKFKLFCHKYTWTYIVQYHLEVTRVFVHALTALELSPEHVLLHHEYFGKSAEYVGLALIKSFRGMSRIPELDINLERGGRAE